MNCLLYHKGAILLLVVIIVVIIVLEKFLVVHFR